MEDWGQPPDLSGALGLRVVVENGTKCAQPENFFRHIVRLPVLAPAGHPGATYAYSINVTGLVEKVHYCYDYVSLKLDDNMLEPGEPPAAPFEDRFVVCQGDQCYQQCDLWATKENQISITLLCSGSDLTLEYDTVDGFYHVECFAEVPNNSQAVLYQRAAQPPALP